MRVMLNCTMTVVVSSACLGFAAGEDKTTDEVTKFALAFKDTKGSDFFGAWSELEQALNRADDAADVATELLSHKKDIVPHRQVNTLLDSLAEDDNAILAARLLLQIARGRVMARSYEGSRVVVGQLLVEDDKADATLVLAQMPILEQGYFAGEVGDVTRPICFRFHGYQELDVPLEAEARDADGVVFIGSVTMKPLAPDQTASLRGTIVLDAASSAESAVVTVTVAMPPINTPHNGYSGRKGWPEGIRVPVSKTGEFAIDGLNPSDYNMTVSAEEHVDFYRKVTLAAAELTDAGTCRLFSSDLGFYIGMPAPVTDTLAWETDYQAALRRAETEKRPLLVMMTATWCGPCKMLEDETLNDPWIRHFLSSFVLVKAYEDKDVEQKYGQNGYPTLVFADSSGETAHKCVGYMPAFRFAGECAKAYKAISQEPPLELRKLIAKEIITLE
jgi:thiol-disulfide isomerase/thioredoxin